MLPLFVHSWCLTRLTGPRTLTYVRNQRQILSRHMSVQPARMTASSAGDADQVGGPTMVHAHHILLDSEEMVDAVKVQLDQKNASFAALAKSLSTCTSKERGGDLGWFPRNTMVKEFEHAAFSNPPGSVVKVKSEFGWHLILVEDHGTASSSITVKEFGSRFGPAGSDDNSSVQLIDCRERSELEISSLPGFLNLPMGEYNGWAAEFENGNFNLDKQKETIIMCHHGVRSAQFCSFLSQQGFLRVRNLVGGIDAYSIYVDPSIPTY